jgi:hypothetical protein
MNFNEARIIDLTKIKPEKLLKLAGRKEKSKLEDKVLQIMNHFNRARPLERKQQLYKRQSRMGWKELTFEKGVDPVRSTIEILTGIDYKLSLPKKVSSSKGSSRAKV